MKLQADLYRDENFSEVQEIDDLTYTVFKLPFLLFDYFNYLVIVQQKDNDGFEYYFKRAYKNYSRFIFDTEIETLLKRIIDVFPIDYGKNAVKEFKEVIYKEEKNLILFQDKYYNVFIRKGDYKPELAFYYSKEIRNLSKKK